MKVHALIASSMNEDVNRQINSIVVAWNYLEKLKDLFESYSKLELIQLQLKLFNLVLKDDDPMLLILEIQVIMHDIDSIGEKIKIALMALIKTL